MKLTYDMIAPRITPIKIGEDRIESRFDKKFWIYLIIFLGCIILCYSLDLYDKEQRENEINLSQIIDDTCYFNDNGNIYPLDINVNESKYNQFCLAN